MVNADTTVTKRLHIGGLTPAITTTHIKDRFASFGTVRDVEEMQPDALGQPRPFTFLTIETTPIQLKKCLNTLSGSFWRGAQLRLAEAKPRYNALFPPAEPSDEEKAKVLEKKRKRVLSSRGEGVGKLAQDMRVVTPQIAAKKKFWVVEQDGRVVRPIAVRPSHPIGVVVSDRAKTDRRPRAPPSRARRRVINPVQWGSTHLTAEQLPSDTGRDEEEGSWDFEEIDADEDEQVAEAEDGKTVLGIWRKTVGEEVVEEQVVRGKRRKVEQDSDYDFNLASDIDDDDSSLFHGGGASSPLFGTRHQALPDSEIEDGQRDRERSASSLFPTRALGAPSPSSAAAPESTPGLEESEESEGSDLDENEEDVGNGSEADSEGSKRAVSPLFPSRPADVEAVEQPSSPLFAARSAPSPPRLQRSPSPAVREDGDVDADALQASSPLFPTRALPSLDRPAKSTIKPSTFGHSDVQAQLARSKAPALPTQIVEIARAEKSAALGVLGALLGGLSPPRERKGKMEWAGFAESDDEDADEVEIARGRSTSAASDAPLSSGVTREIRDEEIIVGNEPVPIVPAPADEETVDTSSTNSSSNSTSGSGSNASSSGSSSSGEGQDEGGMDVDPPAGGSGSGSNSSGSGSGSGSGDDDDSDSDDSDDSSDSDSESDSDSDSDSDEEEDEEDEQKQAKSVDDSNTKPTVPKAVGLKEMFAPGASSSSATFGFGSGPGAGAGAGFSLLADLEPDFELDEEMDIPLPSFAPGTGNTAAATTFGTRAEEELQPLPLISGTSGKGKVKFDANPDIPLFFALPTTEAQASASQSRKGEARNPYNELHTGVPVPVVASQLGQDQNDQYGANSYGNGGQRYHQGGQNQYAHGYQQQRYGDEAMEAEEYQDEANDQAAETTTKPLPAFVRQEGETDESMKKRWEAERVELTQGWKKKHREAKKQRRRKGGEDAE
ncbi:hypothetical protein IAU59_000708 [Kwoniella sp. CBS 9459]